MTTATLPRYHYIVKSGRKVLLDAFMDDGELHQWFLKVIPYDWDKVTSIVRIHEEEPSSGSETETAD